MPKSETVEVVFVHHWRDRRNPKKHRDVLPGARESFPVEEARRLVRGSLATFATKADESTAAGTGNPVTTPAKAAPKKAAATKKAARS